VGYGYYAGLLDEVSIYNRALSASEIQGLYNTSSDGKCSGLLITSQSRDQTAVVGSNVTFVVTVSTASGGLPFSYRWQLNGTNIAGATDSSYTRSNAQVADAGTYTVTVADALGRVASADMLLQVLPFGAPSIQINGRLAAGSVGADGSAQLTISGGFTNGFIFYTLNGTTPTTSSPYYTGPVTLTTSAIVQAMSLSADFAQTAFAPAVWVQVFNLQTSVVGSGRISVNWNNPPYGSNTMVVVTAHAAANWGFDHWTGDVTGSQNPVSLIMNGPHSVQAVFVQTAYSLTATTPGGGTVSVNGQVIPAALFFYPIGSVVTVTAVASNGWSFMGWQGDAGGTNNPLSLTMSQTNNLQGIFGSVVGTNTAGGGGIVLSQPNPIPYGTVLTASAVPDAGEYFVTWSGAASGTNTPTTISVTSANPSVSALFTTLPGGKNTLSVVVMGNGSVAISLQQNYYNQGDSVTLSASTTNAGTSFYGWTGDASGANNPLVVVISTNKTVQANFRSLPSVNVSPQNLIVLVGSNAFLHANAAGLPPLSYQWLKGSVPLGGATNADYTIINAQATNTGNYSVIVSNPYGSATSGVATVTVVFAPSITQQPLSQTLCAGGSWTFQVGASGSPAPGYQWRLNATNLFGATASSYPVSGATPAQAGPYDVMVSNPYGSVTSAPASLTVQTPPTISQQPVGQTLCAGGSWTFQVGASGSPAPTYQWRLNATNISGATASSYPVSGATSAQAGPYDVVVSNPCGSVTSAPVSLTVQTPPTISQQPAGQTLCAGGSWTFQVGASGSPAPGYQWRLNGANISGATASSYQASGATPAQAGPYDVVVSNLCGSASSAPVSLVVQTPPTISQQPVGQTLCAGGSWTFQVGANGSPAPSYQWRLNATNISGATASSYLVSGATHAQAGPYDVVVSNLCGSVTSSIALLAVALPGSVVAWGDNTYGQCNVPRGMTNVFAIAAGYHHSLALKADGAMAGWGEDDFGQTNAPVGLSSVTAIAAGWGTSFALKGDSTLEEWGWDGGYGLRATAGALTNIISVSALWDCGMALKSDNTVFVWGKSTHGETNVPAGLTDVVAISGGGYFCMALKRDGTVVTWGSNAYGQTNTPENLNGVKAIAAGGDHCLALKLDGTVVAWGYDYYGQTDVPPDLTNAVAVSAGGYHSLALRADGTLVAWGLGSSGQTNVPGCLRNVITISAGGFHNLALVAGTFPIQLSDVEYLPGGQLHFTVCGLPEGVYRVLGSTNLHDWQTIASVTNLSGTMQFTDPGAADYSRRFYRLVMP
jgi:alpha-tubulin suppressor-like RCC1 family protein